MKRLISLYPRPWRDRYEDEFVALLSDRPTGPGDGLDIVRGAVDAHLQRLVPETPGRAPRPSRGVVATGLTAVVGGLAWLGWTAFILVYFRGWGAGMPEHVELGQLLSFVTGVAFVSAIVGIANHFHPLMRRGGLFGASLAAVCFSLAAFGGGVAALLALIGLAILAWSLAGGVIPRWVAVIWIASAMTAGISFMAFVAGEGRDVGLLAWALPHGFAWVLAGLAIATHRRPAPAIPSTEVA